MGEEYQTFAQKSTRKFEVLGRKALRISVPLLLVEVWEGKTCSRIIGGSRRYRLRFTMVHFRQYNIMQMPAFGAD